MTATTAALLGAVIGALGGLAGGSFASLASLRASQVAARAPVVATLHKLARAVVRLAAYRSSAQFLDLQREFHESWNDLAIQQKILSPSERIEFLVGLVLRAAEDESLDRDQFLKLAGQALEKIVRMVSAQSKYLFHFRVRLAEAAIIRSWLASEESSILSKGLRSRLNPLARRLGMRG